MLSLLLPAAHAFCGTFVAGPGDDLYNESSQVVYARQGDQTTLTLANDFSGDVGDFAMVIPVPPGIDEDSVSVIEPEVVQALDTFSAPRLVEYTCEDFWYPPYDGPRFTFGCAEYALYSSGQDSYGGGEADDTVTVEAEFTEGEYAFTLISAENGDGLETWLDGHGFALGGEASDMLQDYIDSGSWFLAAKVDVDLHDGPLWLSPIQLTYTSEAMSLPIRLGTLNSEGMQEIILYGLTAEEDGALGIANLQQQDIDTDCMLDEGMSSWYRDELDGVENGWVVEHSWSPYHCDPCTPGGTLEPELVTQLGLEDDFPHFSRLFVRYDAEQSEDLQLYASGMYDQTQRRYIQYDENFEDRFRICNAQDVIQDGGNCDDEFEAMDQEHKAEEGRGCASAHSRFALAGLALLSAMALRFRG